MCVIFLIASLVILSNVMARRFKHDPDVQGLIHALSRLYTGHQTVAGLSALLSDGQPAETKNTFHANRLNGLLDGNMNRAVNEKTFIQLQDRVASINIAEHEDSDYSSMVALIIELLSAGQTKEEAFRILQSTALPPVIAICEQASPSNGTPETAYHPDWSWQVEAVEKTIESLSQHRGSKIGLIIPTGGGKTFIATQAPLRKLQSDPEARCLWVAHRSFLIRQAQKTFGIRSNPKRYQQQNDVNFRIALRFRCLKMQ